MKEKCEKKPRRRKRPEINRNRNDHYISLDEEVIAFYMCRPVSMDTVISKALIHMFASAFERITIRTIVKCVGTDQKPLA
jgi:hypothetical protein